MNIPKKELTIISQFVSWLQNDQTSESFDINKKYPETELVEDNVFGDGFFVKDLSSKFDNKPEFIDLVFIEGIQHKVKQLNDKGIDFIYDNVCILNKHLSKHAIFTQDYTIRAKDGVTSLVGGTLWFAEQP